MWIGRKSEEKVREEERVRCEIIRTLVHVEKE